MAFKQLINKCMLCCKYSNLSSTYKFTTIKKSSFKPLFYIRRKFHFSISTGNVFHNNGENIHAYNVISSQFIDNPSNTATVITCEEDFNLFLNNDWRNSNATSIVEAFKIVHCYCLQHDLNVSDERFDRLVDGLMDHADKLTYTELIDLLKCLSSYPRCSSYKSHNIHDIWSCLDDICCWKMHKWNPTELISVAMIWYKIGLPKYSDFVFEVLNRLTKKADQLTKDELVSLFFLFNVSRLRPVDFEYEYALEQKINELNIDELAVVAMGYFKTRSSIKLSTITEAMIQQVTVNSKEIHEISLSAIMKALRLSKLGSLLNQLNIMFNSLYPEIDRFSNICCIHVALLPTTMGWFHKDILSKIAGKVSKDFHNLRLKDIERTLHPFSMFNYRPETAPYIFENIFEELHKESRQEEIDQHARCLPCALNYLSLQGLYSYPLMNKILDLNYIESHYGNPAKTLPRELFSLDCCIDIDCPDYEGNRLLPSIRYKIVKWNTDFQPLDSSYKKKSIPDQLFLDIYDRLKNIVGNENLIFAGHVLPHFRKADLVVCKNMETGRYVQPLGLEKYILGDIMVPTKDDSLKWFAIMVMSWNNTIRDTGLLLGHALMKERQLTKIGYTPVPVIWNQFMKLTPEKQQYYLYSRLK